MYWVLPIVITMPASSTSLNLPETLSKEEQVEVMRRVKKGNAAQKLIDSGVTERLDQLEAQVADGNAAFEEMYVTNLRLVAYWANHYTRKLPFYAASTLSSDDLFSEGAIGLRRACEKYDFEKGYAFSTYATWWVKQAIQRCIESSSAIRIPNYLVSDVRAAALDASGATSNVNEAMRALSVSSLDEQLAEDLTLADRVAAADTSPEDVLFGDSAGIESPLLSDVEAIISQFSERDQEMLRRRIGLDAEPLSYRALGKQFGLGGNGARYVVLKRLEDLRNGLLERGYEDPACGAND